MITTQCHHQIPRRRSRILRGILIFLGFWIPSGLGRGFGEPCGGPAVARAADLPPLRFHRAVEVPVQGEEEAFSFTLDAEIFQATQERFTDLCLYDNAQDRLVPMLLRSAMEPGIHVSQAHRIVPIQSAKPLEDNALELRVALSPGTPAPLGIELVTPLSNFQHRVQVFGVPDEETPDGDAGDAAEQLLVEEGLIFDHSRFADVRNTRVWFTAPGASSKRLRIVIDGITAAQESQLLELTRELVRDEETRRSEQTTINRRPLRIQQVRIWYEVRQPQAALAAYPPVSTEVQTDSETGETIVEIDTRREPLTQFTLQTSSRNFSRAVRVEVPEVQGVHTHWRTIASGTLDHLDFKELQRNELAIGFPESRHPQYRLVIVNGDNAPLEIDGIEAHGSVKEVVFLAQPGQELTLAYGGDSEVPLRLDAVAISEVLQRGYEPQAARLSPLVKESQVPSGPPLDFRAWLNHPGILLGIITLLVVVLGWFLYQASRRLDAVEDAAN